MKETRRLITGTLGVLLALAAGALVLFAPPWQPGYKPVAAGGQEWRIDVNTADLETLCMLPGVGEKRAQAIIDHRTAHGPFQSLEDLAQVKGISEKTIQGWQGLAYIG